MTVPKFQQYTAAKVEGPPSYFCGFCKGRHSRMETVQQCAIEHYEKTGKPIGVNLRSPDTKIVMDAPSVMDLSAKGERKLPAGHFLIPVQTGKSVVGVHAQIRICNTGRWKGRVFINVWETGAKEPYALTERRDRDEIVKTLLNGNWRRAMLDYGRTYGLCPVCEGPLQSEVLRTGVHRTTECYSAIYG